MVPYGYDAPLMAVTTTLEALVLDICIKFSLQKVVAAPVAPPAAVVSAAPPVP